MHTGAVCPSASPSSLGRPAGTAGCSPAARARRKGTTLSRGAGQEADRREGFFLAATEDAGGGELGKALESLLRQDGDAGAAAKLGEEGVALLLPGPKMGTAKARNKVVKRGQNVMFHFEYSTDGKTWVEAARSFKCSVLISGLTAGSTYFFRYRMWTNGSFSDFSQTLSLMVA